MQTCEPQLRTRTITLPRKSDLSDESMVRKAVPDSDQELQGRHLRLDFSRVEYVASLDLGALVALHKRLGRLGGRLTLANLSSEVREVFTVTHLHRLFEIE